MTEEVKEVLSILNDICTDSDGNYIDNVLNQYETELLLDYINNLQQENERLKTALEKNNNVSIKKYNKLKLEKEELELRLFSINDYKSRCEKAVEYIKEHIKYECDDTINGMSFYSHHLYDFKKEELLNILQGSDKE